MSAFKVGLILKSENKSWILEKIATRLEEHLSALGAEVVFSEHPVADANINHHMSWAFANETSPGPSTMFITHLDDLYKVAQVKSMLSKQVTIGICMSEQGVNQLVQAGVDQNSLVYIPPAHDGLTQPKRIVIGITTRLYPDGRKREELLVKLAGQMRLDAFEFHIFGKGWDDIVPKLERAGAKVVYFGETDDFQKDYATLIAGISKFDYYLYAGMDEGSLGTLDALAAGVKTIVTPQGFHLDLPHGITHPFVTFEELHAVFKTIAGERDERIAGVAPLNWREYAVRHLALWQALVSSKAPANHQMLVYQKKSAGGLALKSAYGIGGTSQDLFWKSLNPRRLLSAVSHLPGFRNLRQLIRRKS